MKSIELAFETSQSNIKMWPHIKTVTGLKPIRVHIESVRNTKGSHKTSGVCF